MGPPVAGADLVADQRVAGARVGDAQQRLGQAHQRHALLAGQRVFVDQPFDAAGAGLPRRASISVRARSVAALVTGAGRVASRYEQRKAFRLRPAVGAGDLGAEHALRLDVLGELQEGLEGGVGGLIRAVFQEGHVGAAVAEQVVYTVTALDPFQHG